MKGSPVYRKVAVDLFFKQGSWTMWFMGIMLIVHLVQAVLFLTGNSDGTLDNFFTKIFLAGNIYMFIIGIIAAVSLLPYFVQNGVTRKDFFTGGVFAAIGLATVIPIAAFLLNALTEWIAAFLNIPVGAGGLPEITGDPDDPLIATVILAVINAPSVTAAVWPNLFLSIMNLFFYYMTGWLIGTGFYRFGGNTGFLFIVIALGVFLTNAGIWGREIPAWLPVPDLSRFLAASVTGTLVLTIIILVIIRLVTKNMRIKI